MKKLIVVFALVLLPLCVTQAQISNKPNTKIEKETPSPWGISFAYCENGFGPAFNYYKDLNSSTQLITGIAIMSVSDSREFEQYDYIGNKMTPNKENRIFLLPLNIGIKKGVFTDDIEGSIRPIINLGISPSLVLTDPYEKEYFSALGSMKAAFAFGGYAGAGLEFKEAKSVAFSFNVNYSYVTPIGKEINSLYDHPINNLTGFQIAFGVKF